MNRLHRPRWSSIALGILCAALMSACAGNQQHREGLVLVEQGQYEAGLQKLDEAAKADPDNPDYRADFRGKRDEILRRLLGQAEMQIAATKLEEAEAVYRQVLQIDRTNEAARSGLESIQRKKRNQRLIADVKESLRKGDIDRAYSLAQTALTDEPNNAEMQAIKQSVEEKQSLARLTGPTLRPGSGRPVTLEFRDAPVRMVFDVLTRTTGINFILDRDVRPDLRATIAINQAPLDEAIDLLLNTTQLEKKILGQNSVLIYPRTAEKAKEFQDLVVKSFYLANADPKQVQATLKTLLKTRDVVVDDKLNLLIMRDSPEAIRLAEKVIALQDLIEPEVMLEVEVLEVQRSLLIDLGIQYPNQVSLTPLSAAGGSSLTLSDLRALNSDTIGVGVGSVLVNLRKEDGLVNLLANPRIRVRNREKARILIGDKVPVITTTATSTGFVSENVQYLDVGLKLEVEPNIYLRDDVGIKVNLEVSAITREVKSTSGTLSYQIGTRNATTALRLRDGETQVLAGLINDQDRKSANKIPGLGDLPVLGRLFGSHHTEKTKTEIVLSITPRIIRNLNRPDVFAEEFWSGTENNLRLAPVTMAALGTSLGSATPGNVNAPPNAAAGSSSSPGAPNVMLSWDGPTSAKAGETFQLSLTLKSDVELQGLPLRIDFDPKSIEVLDVSEGGFFKQNSGNTAFSTQIDNGGGKILVALSRTSGDSAKGEDKVLTLTLKAKGGKEGLLSIASALPVTIGQGKTVMAPPKSYTVTVVN